MSDSILTKSSDATREICSNSSDNDIRSGVGLFKRKCFIGAFVQAWYYIKTFAVLSGVRNFVVGKMKRLQGKDDVIDAGVAGCCTHQPALSFPAHDSIAPSKCEQAEVEYNEKWANYVQKKEILNSMRTTEEIKDQDLEELHLKMSDNDVTLYNNRGGVSSNAATNNITSSNFGEIEVVRRHSNKKKEEPKARSKCNKKEVNTNNKSRQEVTTPTYNPRQLIGIYICKEYGGERSLGTVISYHPKKKLLKVQYENYGIEYLEHNEVVNNIAKYEDIMKAQQALRESNCSKKTTNEKRKKIISGERSTPMKKRKIMAQPGEGSTPTKKRKNIAQSGEESVPPRKKKNTSSKKGKSPYVAFRIRASNA